MIVLIVVQIVGVNLNIVKVMEIMDTYVETVATSLKHPIRKYKKYEDRSKYRNINR